MQPLRALLLRHRALAALLVALALCLKITIPVGSMVSQGAGAITISICSPATGHALPPIVLPIKPDQAQDDDTAAPGDCSFALLSMAATDGADPALLLLAIAFVMALGFAPMRRPAPARAHHLRPPLRGPPLPA